MTPSSPWRLQLRCEGNGYTGTVSAQAAGIIATAMALSHLSCQFEEERLIDTFYQMRDFAFTHEEAPAIFKALD